MMELFLLFSELILDFFFNESMAIMYNNEFGIVLP